MADIAHSTQDVSVLDNATGAPLEILSDGAAKVAPSDSAGVRISPAKEDGNLALIKAKTDNLDVALSSGSAKVKITDSGGANILASRMMPGAVSSGNTTTTPLGAGATFTGSFENVDNFASVVITVFSGQSSAANGLVFQWSSDGVNVDRSEASGLTGGSQGLVFTLTVRSSFFRVVYTNGATPQTNFRLKTVYHQVGHGHISKPMAQPVTDDNFAELVQAPIMARLASGAFVNLGAVETPNGESALQAVSYKRISYESRNNRVYSVSFNFNLPTNGTESPILLIRNPSGSGKRLYLYRAIFSSLANANNATFRLYASPTVTATGTAATITSNHVGGGAPASSMQAFTGPGISANGALLRHMSCGTGNASLSFSTDFDLGVILAPGFDLLLTGTPSGNNTNTATAMAWVEAT